MFAVTYSHIGLNMQRCEDDPQIFWAGLAQLWPPACSLSGSTWRAWALQEAAPVAAGSVSMKLWIWQLLPSTGAGEVTASRRVCSTCSGISPCMLVFDKSLFPQMHIGEFVYLSRWVLGTCCSICRKVYTPQVHHGKAITKVVTQTLNK